MDNAVFNTVLSGLTQKIAQDESQWLELALLDALWQVGEPATDENLQQYLPRLSCRRYADGTIILALDAAPADEHRRGTRGRVLFGFGEGKLERLPLEGGDTWKWVRPFLDERRALAYELSGPAGSFDNFRDAPYPHRADEHPLPLKQPEQLWPNLTRLMLEQHRAQVQHPYFPAPPPGFGLIHFISCMIKRSKWALYLFGADLFLLFVIQLYHKGRIFGAS